MISTIKSSNPNGSGSTPSIGGRGSSPGIASSPDVQAPQQSRVVDIRLDDDAILTGAAVKQLITSVISADDDVVLNITNAQNELTRTGTI